MSRSSGCRVPLGWVAATRAAVANTELGGAGPDEAPVSLSLPGLLAAELCLLCLDFGLTDFTHFLWRSFTASSSFGKKYSCTIKFDLTLQMRLEVQHEQAPKMMASMLHAVLPSNDSWVCYRKPELIKP